MLKDRIIKILEDKKAIDIVDIDVREKNTFTDNFIIASGTSNTHVKALSDNIEKDLKEDRIIARKIEGYETGRWILMDYGEVIVHIFHPEERQFYDLEELWQNTINKIQE